MSGCTFLTAECYSHIPNTVLETRLHKKTSLWRVEPSLSNYERDTNTFLILNNSPWACLHTFHAFMTFLTCFNVSRLCGLSDIFQIVANLQKKKKRVQDIYWIKSTSKWTQGSLVCVEVRRASLQTRGWRHGLCPCCLAGEKGAPQPAVSEPDLGEGRCRAERRL